MTTFGPENPFWEGFETDPLGQRANYFGRLASQPRKSPNQRKFFQGQFEEVQNRYLGQLGKMVQGGQNPTRTLNDFLQDYFAQGGEGDEDFLNATLGSRIAAGNRFAPPVRFLL